jgi:hypothetical protein
VVGWERTERISPGLLLGGVDRLKCWVTMASKTSLILSDGVSCVKVAVCVLTDNLDWSDCGPSFPFSSHVGQEY